MDRRSRVNGALDLSRTAPFHDNALISEAACEIYELGIVVFQRHGMVLWNVTEWK